MPQPTSLDLNSWSTVATTGSYEPARRPELTRSRQGHAGGVALWGLWHTCPALRGLCATSLGLGATARTSAASVTFAWWIRALWLIRGTRVPAINHGARIHHDNRRASPPAVTPAMSRDSCDERGQGGAVTRSSSPLSSAGGKARQWHSWHGPLGIGVPPDRPQASVTCRPSHVSREHHIRG
jgi:hypothetical protein